MNGDAVSLEVSTLSLISVSFVMRSLSAVGLYAICKTAKTIAAIPINTTKAISNFFPKRLRFC